jgi:hypothetical protein
MILVYLDVNDSILLKAKDTSFHVLYWILLQMNKEENVWYSDKINKQEICEKLMITSITLEKALFSLKARELIISKKKGVYALSNTIVDN